MESGLSTNLHSKVSLRTVLAWAIREIPTPIVSIRRRWTQMGLLFLRIKEVVMEAESLRKVVARDQKANTENQAATEDLTTILTKNGINRTFKLQNRSTKLDFLKMISIKLTTIEAEEKQIKDRKTNGMFSTKNSNGKMIAMKILLVMTELGRNFFIRNGDEGVKSY